MRIVKAAMTRHLLCDKGAGIRVFSHEDRKSKVAKIVSEIDDIQKVWGLDV